MRCVRLFALALLSLWVSGSAQKVPPLSEEGLPPIEESEALRRYLRRPKTELTRLLYLADRFLNTEFQVIYNGRPYDSNTAVKYARSYLFKNHKKEKAESWIKVHAHRAGNAGEIIYVKYPSGAKRPAREFLLEELQSLDAAMKDPGGE